MSASNQFAVSLSNKSVWIFDTIGNNITTLETDKEARCLTFNQNSNLLAGFTPNNIFVWNNSGNHGYSWLKTIWTTQSNGVSTCVFSGESEENLVAGSCDNHLYVYNIKKEKAILNKYCVSEFTVLEPSGSGFIASGHMNGSIRTWDLKDKSKKP